MSSSCCVIFLSYSVGEEEVNCLGDPKGTVLTDRPPSICSQKLNDAWVLKGLGLGTVHTIINVYLTYKG